jgi:hypothetical protein
VKERNVHKRSISAFPKFERGKEVEQLANWIIEHCIDNQVVTKHMHDSILRGEAANCNKGHKSEAMKLALDKKQKDGVMRKTFGHKKLDMLFTDNFVCQPDV